MLPFWFALVSLRPSEEDALSLLAVMGLVWIADIGAYFCGKAFGKNKLAPAISPTAKSTPKTDNDEVPFLSAILYTPIKMQ